MKHLLLITTIILSACAEMKAQYHAAVGLRGGKFTSGLTAKYFFSRDNASGIEVIIGRTKIAKGGWVGTALYEHKFPLIIPIIQLPLDFICGAGGHVGYYPKRYYEIVEGKPVYYNDKSVAMGIDAIIALEYLVPIVWLPFSVGIEAQPFVDLVNQGPEHLDLAITLRYVFNE